MKLSQLFPATKLDLDLDIDQLVCDSRSITPGTVFFALTRSQSAFDQYLEMAVAKGATAVIYDASLTLDDRYTLSACAIPDFLEQMPEAASLFYGEPSQKLCIIGVTGTNGKTSCCHLLAQALTALGFKAGVLGTAGNGVWPKLDDAALTTLPIVDLQALMARFVEAGVTHVVMEVSSHAIAQGRVAGLSFDIGIFTNLSREHLDYHGDMVSYAAVKRRFFDLPMKYAVLNLDQPTVITWLSEWPDSALQTFTYSLEDSSADLYLETESVSQVGQSFRVMREGGSLFESETRLLGRFNLYNLLAVVASLLMLKCEPQKIAQILPNLCSVRGRMQRLSYANAPEVVVDYAHTPDALANALGSLKAVPHAKLWCVVGCGGDRDRGKRPEMAAVAENLADYCIFTNDNPRTESPEGIVSDMLSGVSNPGAISVIYDRKQAIAEAISRANQDDIVLIAGKGHETYQIIGHEKRHFSDVEVVTSLLES